jgi:hypothetical protein
MHTAVAIEGFPDYLITRTGKVMNRNGSILKPAPNHGGYLRVWLYARKRRKRKRVHVLVCEAFHGRRPTRKHEVLHRDNDRQNNHAENLRWGTCKENGHDKRIAGTVRGDRNPNAKLTNEQVMQAQADKQAGMTYDQIAIRYMISKVQAWRICTNRRKVS